jgi:hypothetical protein
VDLAEPKVAKWTVSNTRGACWLQDGEHFVLTEKRLFDGNPSRTSRLRCLANPIFDLDTFLAEKFKVFSNVIVIYGFSSRTCVAIKVDPCNNILKKELDCSFLNDDRFTMEQVGQDLGVTLVITRMHIARRHFFFSLQTLERIRCPDDTTLVSPDHTRGIRALDDIVNLNKEEESSPLVVIFVENEKRGVNGEFFCDKNRMRLRRWSDGSVVFCSSQFALRCLLSTENDQMQIKSAAKLF